MRERGSALLVAVVSVMVLLLISGMFFSLTTNQMKSNSYEERAIKSYYLAQAGVFYGVAKLKAGFVPELNEDGISDPDPKIDPFGYGGQFTVRWEKFESGYLINSIGSYGKDTGQVDRILKAYYKTSSAEGTSGVTRQELLDVDEIGDAQTIFYVSNDDPTDLPNGYKFEKDSPVNLNEPIFIFIINDINGDYKNRYATDVQLTLKTIDDTVYTYPVGDFRGVNGVNHNGIGEAKSILIDYNGSETVRLEVEGRISSNLSPGSNTVTITNYFLLNSDGELMWQIEN